MNANLRTTFHKDRASRRPRTVAPAVSQSAGEPRNGIGRNLSRPGRDELAGEHTERRHAALPDDHRPNTSRRPLRRWAESPAQTERQERGEQAHAVDGMEPQTALAAHEKAPVLPGFASDCDYAAITRSGGDRIRTCDLEVMSLASYRTAPPRVLCSPIYEQGPAAKGASAVLGN